MSDSGPKKQTKPVLRRIDGPPKPPTKVTLDLGELGEPPSEDRLFWETSSAFANIYETLVKLDSLNGRERRLERETLELSLDRNIVLLGKTGPKLDSEWVELVTRALGRARDYRRDFPRTDPSNAEQAKQAQHILDAIPEV